MGWPGDFQPGTLKVFPSVILLSEVHLSKGDMKTSAAGILILLDELEGFLV